MVYSSRPKLDNDTALIRVAVRDFLKKNVVAGDLVLVGLSGGPDSLALAGATGFVARKLGVRAGAVIVDHNLQEGSAVVAEEAAGKARMFGLDPVVVVKVDVAEVGAGGPENAARDARREALEGAATEFGARGVLLGHTLDEQAETVLLGLARGSGAASLHGMAEVNGVWMRPLLGVRKASTVASCEAQGWGAWTDPHNSFDKYTRVRVRNTVLPMLEKELSPTVKKSLARTATMLREDNDALDFYAHTVFDTVVFVDGVAQVEVDVLKVHPTAVRKRIIHMFGSENGFSWENVHVNQIEAFVSDWRGQGVVYTPGFRVTRENNRVVFVRV